MICVASSSSVTIMNRNSSIHDLFYRSEGILVNYNIG